MVVKMLTVVFWVVTQYSLVGGYQGFSAKLVITYNTYNSFPFKIGMFLLRQLQEAQYEKII
jgi:hypothetical protein